MKDVSEIDKIAIFTWGRCLERAQMIYHRYSIAHDAISVSKTVKTFHHGTFPAKHVAAKFLVNHIMILAIVKQNNCLTKFHHKQMPADVDELLAQHSSCVDPAGSWYVTGFSMRGSHFLLLQFLVGSSETESKVFEAAVKVADPELNHQDHERDAFFLEDIVSELRTAEKQAFFDRYQRSREAQATLMQTVLLSELWFALEQVTELSVVKNLKPCNRFMICRAQDLVIPEFATPPLLPAARMMKRRKLMKRHKQPPQHSHEERSDEVNVDADASDPVKPAQPSVPPNQAYSIGIMSTGVLERASCIGPTNTQLDECSFWTRKSQGLKNVMFEFAADETYKERFYKATGTKL
ncbi:uncharacterized protein PITG_02319 [Phytophthora infestans T30-4]|uniref:Uncharacterized protein n=1 Tax=Phytophthora infestans (strain T30-4) TaxID=403677 RepID=D0MW09_PHYIT|nr:uncharacterized protein PITG_02319 [Phytophthora infestans T30-4]EEY63822.1 hypothetical protein PITG_02319 [Phytophthora infestans T30-4]|eukprot:XP_002907258.1 hypothetical protein PITG_02319 [Phytophthora infestans T30-4]